MCTYVVGVVGFQRSAYHTREGIGLMHSTLQLSKEVAYEVIIRVRDVPGTATGESSMYVSYIRTYVYRVIINPNQNTLLYKLWPRL